MDRRENTISAARGPIKHRRTKRKKGSTTLQKDKPTKTPKTKLTREKKDCTEVNSDDELKDFQEQKPERPKRE